MGCLNNLVDKSIETSRNSYIIINSIKLAFKEMLEKVEQQIVECTKMEEDLQGLLLDLATSTDS